MTKEKKETKYFGKTLKQYQDKKEWNEAYNLIDNYIETSSTFETSRLDTIRSLNIALDKLFNAELKSDKVMVSASTTLSQLFDKIADQDKETMQGDYYKNLKKEVVSNTITNAFNDTVELATQDGTDSYKSGKNTLKNEWKSGDMIAKQNDLVPMTTDGKGNPIANNIEAKQKVSVQTIKELYSSIIGGTTSNKPIGLIGKVKQLNESLLHEVLGLKVNLELLELLNHTDDIIDYYINYTETLDSNNDATLATYKLGKEMVSKYNSTNIVLNKVKLPKAFKSKQVLGNVKAEAIENNADREPIILTSEKTGTNN